MFCSGDSFGTISINYSIVYLPVGVTDPIQGDSSVVIVATGSVQLKMWKEFNVTIISEDAFLEPRANFYAYLNSTAGGAYACIQASKVLCISREPINIAMLCLIMILMLILLYGQCYSLPS